MISVSGKYWEEEKYNKRIIDKIKIEQNLSEEIAKQIYSKKFDYNEVFSINNDLELKNPFVNNLDFQKGVKLLNDTIKNKEIIFVIGDYDVDGCISTILLIKLLKKLNASYFYYIPNRFTDGYGSSLNLIKKIVQKKPSLVITVDNGSSSNEAINFLNKIKIKSIIIDHHDIYKPYPKTDVLVNPKKKCSYSEFEYLCASTLTYFFIDLYIRKNKLKFNFSNYLQLVFLAIIADVMPLRKINRTIAKKALYDIKKKTNFFFKKVFEIKKINKPIEINDFGFLFGPIINSAGRLDDPNIIIKLFTSNNNNTIIKIVNKLIFLNEKRKKAEKQILETLDFKKIKSDPNPVIILEKKYISEGLIGIIASRIKTYFNKPSIIITKSGNIYKGSARSTKNLNIGKLIKNAIDIKLLDNGGGHNLAAGFTLKKKNINTFKNFVYNYSKNNLAPKYKYNSKLSFSALNNNFLKDLSKMKPYGEGNPNPYYLIENIKIIKSKILSENVISCLISNKLGKIIRAVSFNFMNNDIAKNLLNNKNELSIIVQLEENFWKNKKNLQIIIIDIIISSNKA